jgi:molecular chaperone GrpE
MAADTTDETKPTAGAPEGASGQPDASQGASDGAAPKASAVPTSGMTEDEMVETAIRAGEQAAADDFKAARDAKAAEADDLRNQVAKLEEDLESAKGDLKAANDRVARLQADWENYRRRTAEERLAERDRASEGLVKSLLPVIDDLERALDHASANAQGNEAATQLAEGVAAVHAKFVDTLAKEGVEVIDPAGEPFDPLQHQAVGRAEDADAYEDTVRDVYQRGYRMGGKVIRPAMVTVTFGGPKRPAEADDAGPGDASGTGDEGK